MNNQMYQSDIQSIEKYDITGVNSSTTGADWEQLQIVKTYLQANYPIKYVSLSPDGQNIAIAGKQGFAIYNRGLRKWRLFGDVFQEAEIKPNALEWIDNIVVAVVHRNTEEKSEVWKTYVNSCFADCHVSSVPFGQVLLCR